MKIRLNRPLIKYIRENWKLMIHIIFHTRRFGVNNKWWESFDAFISDPWWKICINTIGVFPIWRNYLMGKFRMSIGFVDRETWNMFYPNEKKPNLNRSLPAVILFE